MRAPLTPAPPRRTIAAVLRKHFHIQRLTFSAIRYYCAYEYTENW